MDKSKTPQVSLTEISIIATPAQANTLGTVFGGKLMEWMDMAAAICARRHSNLRVITAAVNDIRFIKPIYTGQVIKTVAQMNRVFGSSMDIKVDVYGEDSYENKTFLAATGIFLVVGTDENKQPVNVPDLVVLTDDEKHRWEMAGKRRETFRETENNRKE